MNEHRNIYEDEAKMRGAVDAGEHREIIGGMWDAIGALQIDFLKTRGLEPEHYLLDLGCGSGRLAVRAVPYLQHDRYYGIDISPSLLRAARDEIEALDLGAKLNRHSFHATSDFRPSVDMPRFNFVMAQSLFTHLPLGQFGNALLAVSKHMAVGGKFYATFFVAPYNTPSLIHARGGVTTYADKDPYHHPKESIIEQAIYRSWRIDFIGEWGHPRDQQICECTLLNNPLEHCG